MDIIRIGRETNVTVIPENGSQLERELQGRDVVTLHFYSNIALDITISDYIAMPGGTQYNVSTMPEVDKRATNRFKYVVTFEAISYHLNKVLFKDPRDLFASFDLVGNIDTHLALLITNLDRAASIIFTAGTTVAGADLTINYNNVNCLQALQKMAQEFGLEYEFDGQEISLKTQAGPDNAVTLEYKAGVRGIARKLVNTENLTTVLYGYGGTKNLPGNYRDLGNGPLRRLVFQGKTAIFGAALSDNYAIYGRLEAQVTFEDIYPRLIAEVTGIGGTNLIFSSTDIDFDVWAARMTGETPKISFTSGDLSGYVFDIKAYDHATKTFTLEPLTESDFILPDTNLKPALTNTFVLLDIIMPGSYESAAENELEDATDAAILELENPRVKYTIKPDWPYFRENALTLEIGEFITIIDTDLGVNYKTRIIKLSNDLVNPYKYTLELSDFLQQKIGEEIIKIIIRDGNKPSGSSLKAGSTGAPPVDAYSKAISDERFVNRALVNGTFMETFQCPITSNGQIITATLALFGGGNLTMQFSDGNTLLDCITTPVTIALTAGTIEIPQDNYVYILKSTKVITLSASGWPSVEHIRIGYFYCETAVYVQSDGPLVNQLWNDHLKGVNEMGHLAHMAARSRALGALYQDGIDPAGTTNYLTSAAGTVYFKSTAGEVMQMHEHIVPAIDMSTGDDCHIINDYGAKNKQVSNLYDVTTDAQGGTLNNKYFNIVFFGVANLTGTYSPLLALMPEGTYNNLGDAQSDVSGYTNYALPAAYKRKSSTGFNICIMTIRKAGGTWVWHSTIDLRDINLVSASGGGGGVQVFNFPDSLFRIHNNADPTKVIAMDASAIATGNTRVVTVPDDDGVLAYANGLGGGQTIHGGKAVDTHSLVFKPNTHDTPAAGAHVGIETGGTASQQIARFDADTRRVIFGDGDPSAAVHINHGFGQENGLAFGDGDTGIFEQDDDQLVYNVPTDGYHNFNVNAVPVAQFNAAGLNMQNNTITAVGSIQFDIVAEPSNPAKGAMNWDNEEGTLAIGMGFDDVFQSVGMETYYRIKNLSGVQIDDGAFVMFDGSIGASGVLKGKAAIGAEINAFPLAAMGVATMDIVNGNDGYITHFGLVRGVDTSAWADGAVLWFDPTVTGGLTDTMPAAPNAKISVAAVVHSDINVGSFFVRPHISVPLFHINDVYNYDPDTLASNSFMNWDSSGKFWQIRTTAQVITDLAVLKLDASNGPLTGNLGIENAGNAYVYINSDKDGVAPAQSRVYFQGNSINLWHIGLDADGDFYLYDHEKDQAIIQIINSSAIYITPATGRLDLKSEVIGVNTDFYIKSYESATMYLDCNTNDTTTTNTAIHFRETGLSKWTMGRNIFEQFYLYDNAAVKNVLVFNPNSFAYIDPAGAFQVGFTTDQGYAFAVLGTAYFSDNVNIANAKTYRINGANIITPTASWNGTNDTLGASMKAIKDYGDSNWSGGAPYPGVGIPLSTGSAWETSITNNSDNWNMAFGWGDPSTLYLALAGGTLTGHLTVSNEVDAYLYINSATDGGNKELSYVRFQHNGVTHWSIGKSTSNSFILKDDIQNASVMIIASGGQITYTPSSGVVQFNGGVGGVNSVQFNFYSRVNVTMTMRSNATNLNKQNSYIQWQDYITFRWAMGKNNVNQFVLRDMPNVRNVFVVDPATDFIYFDPSNSGTFGIGFTTGQGYYFQIDGTGYFSDNLNIAAGKTYRINGTTIITPTASFDDTSDTLGASMKAIKDYGDSNWSGGGMVYPGAGIPLSTGSAWGTSITNNSGNWNTAFGWGNHTNLYLPLGGGTLSGNVILEDNVSIYWGTDSDANIYFDGTNLQMKLGVTDWLIGNGTTIDEYMRFYYNGGTGYIDLRYNGSAVMATANAAINILDNIVLQFNGAADGSLYYDTTFRWRSANYHYLENLAGAVVFNTNSTGVNIATGKTYQINGATILADATSAGIVKATWEADDILGVTRKAISAYVAANASGGAPGGSNTQLQYNNDGAFGGMASLTYNNTTHAVTLGDTYRLNFGGTGTYMYQVNANFELTNVFFNQWVWSENDDDVEYPALIWDFATGSTTVHTKVEQDWYILDTDGDYMAKFPTNGTTGTVKFYYHGTEVVNVGNASLGVTGTVIASSNIQATTAFKCDILSTVYTGVTGTFTNHQGRTITVKGGLITEISAIP